MKMNYDECRARISILNIAEDLGYKRISGPAATNLTYVLGNPRNPDDEIVIFPAKNSYFSRKGSLDDKGELTKFVLKRLHMFPYVTQTGYRGVNEVLSKYLNSENTVINPQYNNQNTKNFTKEFNITYWNPRPLKSDNVYLTKTRKLSVKTVDDFTSRLLIYQVGKHDNIGFPFRKPGQMEILNFEMRNYFAANNTNYKGFAMGGNKTESCWIANFVPFDKVTDIYIFESGIDAMSFYEIGHFSKDTTSAFISTGGYVSAKQIENINRLFPSNKVKWNCCYDNDGSGQGFDVATAYFLKGEECKAFARTHTGDIFKTIYLNFPNGDTLSFKENEFSSKEFLQQRGISNINVIKPPRYKDWNELLIYYKRFDLNLGPGMKFIPAIEETMSQLNLRGYCQLANMLETNGQALIQSLLSQSSYSLAAPLAENSAYQLITDCRILMGIDALVVIPYNLYVFDKTTQKSIPAYPMHTFLKNEGINILRDLHANDFKDLLDKQTLTYTKVNSQRNFEMIISPTGWGLKECATLKTKDVDMGLEL